MFPSRDFRPITPAGRAVRRSVLVIRLIESYRLSPQLRMAFGLWPGVDYPFFRTV
jgi:hypothetical protein